jgi:hypothetical protein
MRDCARPSLNGHGGSESAKSGFFLHKVLHGAARIVPFTVGAGARRAD